MDTNMDRRQMMIAFDMRYGLEMSRRYLRKSFIDTSTRSECLFFFIHVAQMSWIHDGKNGVARTDGPLNILKVQVISHKGIKYQGFYIV